MGRGDLFMLFSQAQFQQAIVLAIELITFGQTPLTGPYLTQKQFCIECTCVWHNHVMRKEYILKSTKIVPIAKSRAQFVHMAMQINIPRQYFLYV